LLAALALPLTAVDFQFMKFGQVQQAQRIEIDEQLISAETYTWVAYVVRRTGPNDKTIIIQAYRQTVDFAGFEYAPEPYIQSDAMLKSLYNDTVAAFLAFQYRDDDGNPIPVTKHVQYGFALATPAPRVFALDAYSDNLLVSMDLATFVPKSSAKLDSFRGFTFALRPDSNGRPAEAWIPTFQTGPGSQMSVVDVGSGSILTKFTVGNNGEPVRIVFSNTGETAFELVSATDGTGSGTLLAFDAATRTLRSSVPIPFYPYGMAISPDGSTVYVIGIGSAGASKILYFDLLSATADLTVTLPNTESFTGPYLMHPNGRIYGQNSGRVLVFDPQARKIISKFDLGYSAGLYVQAMRLTQDGRQLYVLDSAALRGQSGNIQVLDAETGASFGSAPIGGLGNSFFLAPTAP
jgi:hypothetical protein